LRELDKREVLRNDVMVVGTNAFIAYRIVCNARFPTGIEETDDFESGSRKAETIRHRTYRRDLRP